MIVYKYMTAARVDVLENGNIRFTQPGALNDPFEALPVCTEYMQQLLPKFIEQMKPSFEERAAKERQQSLAYFDTLPAQMREMLDELFAFLSITKKRNNLLMWSHYADSHKGFILGMDSDSPFFKPGNGKGVEGLRKVGYSQKRHVMPRAGLADLSREQVQLANSECFFVKSLDWSYEEELRILGDPKRADVNKPGPADSKHPIFLYKFPPDCVQQVILGYRMEKADRDKIVDVVDAKYSHAQVFEAVLSETDFAVEVVPLRR